VYAAGYLLFARGDNLMAQSFDPAKGELKGDPQPIASGVIDDPATWHMDVSATESGLLVYSSGVIGDTQLVWVDRSGKDVGVAVDNLRDLTFAKLSPQGDRLALQMDTGAGSTDIWEMDLARGVRTRLTFGSLANNLPTWSPDGKWIYYASMRNGRMSLFRRSADGSGAEENVYTGDHDVWPTDISRDGKTVLLHVLADHQHSMWALPLTGPGKPWKIVDQGLFGAFSPDGRYVAYHSSESGQPQVYVVPFGDQRGKWQASSKAGARPIWSSDGKELYYLEFVSGTVSIVAVPVQEQGDGLQFGTPQTLIGEVNVAGLPNYDVSRDGKKVLISRLSQQVNQSVTLVTNFTEGLQQER